MDLKGTTEEVIHPLPQAKRQQHANHWDQRRTSLKKKNGLQYISLSDLILVNIYESKDNISLKNVLAVWKWETQIYSALVGKKW